MLTSWIFLNGSNLHDVRHNIVDIFATPRYPTSQSRSPHEHIATPSHASLIAVSCPSSSRYHRTLSRNLTRLPTPLAVSLHRTVGGWFAPSSRLPPCRRLGLHRPGGDGARPWRGSDNTLSARTACRPTQCTAARQPAPRRASRLRVRAPDFEPGRCRGAYGRIELHGSANNVCREETVCRPHVTSRSRANRPSEATNATGTITRVLDAWLPA